MILSQKSKGTRSTWWGSPPRDKKGRALAHWLATLLEPVGYIIHVTEETGTIEGGWQKGQKGCTSKGGFKENYLGELNVKKIL